MTSNKRVGVVTLLAALALMLGACGSKTTTTGTASSADTAQVTFQSEPNAEIWIDGKASGNTPTVVSLASGTHEVTLKREGFTDVTESVTVEGGKDITVTGALPVAGTDVSAFRRVLAMLGDKHEPLSKPTTHRGVGEAVTLYYPSGDVRRAGLNTYRIEVDPSYDYEGYIEFRKGTKVLHREKFEPESTITEKALPAEVLEAARNGAKLSWGLTYDSKRRKKDQTLAKFNIISKSREKKVDRALAKVQERRAFKTASPLMQEMIEADQLKRYRLYSEVLVRSLGILNGWSETELPYANMVDVMTRLKLKDSSLYQFASKKVSGGGGMRLVKGGTSSVTDKNRNVSNKGDRGNAQGLGTDADRTVQGGSLPLIAVAPPAARSGKTATAGGMGVQPTDSGAREGANAKSTPDAGGTGVAPTAGGQGQVDRVQRAEAEAALEAKKSELREADLRLARATDAEEAREALHQELQDMADRIPEMDAEAQAARDAADAAEQAAKDAEKKLADLEQAPGTNPKDLRAAREAAETARQSAIEAAETAAAAKDGVQQLEQLQQEMGRKDKELQQIIDETGGVDAAQKDAERLRNEVERMERELEGDKAGDGRKGNGGTVNGGGDGAPGTNGQIPGQTTRPGKLTPEQRADLLTQARQDLDAAQSALKDANQLRDDVADEVTKASDLQNEAQQAYEAIADGTLPAAQADLDAKAKAHDDLVQAGAPQADIDAAKAAADAAASQVEQLNLDLEKATEARDQAEANAARAQIEAERAAAAAARAAQDVAEAEAEISKLSN